MYYTFCPHKRIKIAKLPFHCDDCIREDERRKVYELLKVFTVKAPKESYSGTFTPEQFIKFLESKRVGE